MAKKIRYYKIDSTGYVWRTISEGFLVRRELFLPEVGWAEDPRLARFAQGDTDFSELSKAEADKIIKSPTRRSA